MVGKGQFFMNLCNRIKKGNWRAASFKENNWSICAFITQFVFLLSSGCKIRPFSSRLQCNYAYLIECHNEDGYHSCIIRWIISLNRWHFMRHQKAALHTTTNKIQYLKHFPATLKINYVALLCSFERLCKSGFIKTVVIVFFPRLSALIILAFAISNLFLTSSAAGVTKQPQWGRPDRQRQKHFTVISARFPAHNHPGINPRPPRRAVIHTT